MSLILAVSLYIWASLFVAGKHLMASSAKLRHHTKWKDPILLLQWTTTNNSNTIATINNKNETTSIQKNISSSKINNFKTIEILAKSTTTTYLLCDEACEPWSVKSAISDVMVIEVVPCSFSIIPLTLIRHFHCIFELLSLFLRTLHHIYHWRSYKCAAQTFVDLSLSKRPTHL